MTERKHIFDLYQSRTSFDGVPALKANKAVVLADVYCGSDMELNKRRRLNQPSVIIFS